jgi:hypothetical protein
MDQEQLLASRGWSWKGMEDATSLLGVVDFGFYMHCPVFAFDMIDTLLPLRAEVLGGMSSLTLPTCSVSTLTRFI